MSSPPDGLAGRKKLGLFGAFAVVLGFVVGASIFVLPGGLYSIAGPAMLLSFAIAAIPAALSCVIAAQVGSAFPTDAANIVMVRRVLSPFWGAATAWSFVGSSIAALPLIAYGFADYLAAIYAPLAPHRSVVALSVIALFTCVNVVGAKLAATFQTLMVICLLAALLLFIIKGAPSISFDYFSPFAPNGLRGVAFAVVPAFFAYLGFSLIVEIAGEVAKPERTIPLALGLSFGVITLLYLIVAATIIGVLPAEDLSSSGSAIAAAAAKAAPGWPATFITAGALLATATTINAIILLASRDAAAFLASAQGMQLTGSELTPAQRLTAVLVVGLAGLASAFAAAAIASYAIATVIGFLIAKSIICAAALRLPAYFGPAYRDLAFKLDQSKLRFVSWALLIVTMVFIVMSLLGEPGATIAILLYMALGTAIFGAGQWVFSRR
ncbi:MAG: APC family permease [Sphingomonadales bacterium]|nr:APC family permease [Sphingomonadales bacterium]